MRSPAPATGHAARWWAAWATGSGAGRQGGEDLLSPLGGLSRVGVRRADQRIPVQVVEQLGRAGLGVEVCAAADLRPVAGERQVVVAPAGPDDAAHDDPYGVRVPARLLGRAADD